MRQYRATSLITAGLGLMLLTGCQTYNLESGLTLPTGHYLRHTPQYFPPSPTFPLQRELNSQEDAHRQYEENLRATGQ